MVRSKDVPKKPKDALLTPPSKLRGAGFLDEGGLPSNRVSATMSPAPASVPNYMRATSSSDAKGGRRRARLAATAVPASASPARRRTAALRVVTRGKVLFPEAPGSGPVLGRATCSSTLKEAKFPYALDLAPGATDAEGPASMRVCPYTYCSLNGHAHAPALPLRSFLASRRRLIKTQQSMKLKGVSAFRKKSGDTIGGGAAAVAKIAPLIDGDAVGDFFIEVYAGPRVSSDMSCSDMSLDEMDATVRKMEFVVFDRCGADEDSEKGKNLVACCDGERDGRLGEKHGACRDSSSVCSDAVISGDFVEELPWMRYHRYEYDSLDDGISGEQVVRDDEIDQPQISEEREGKGNEGTSDRLGDECEEKAAEEYEANDEENISNLVLESGPQEGVACRLEACQKLDTRDEDNIMDALSHREPSAGQAAEEKFSDPVDKSEIPDQELAGRVDSSILKESCIEETSVDQEAKYDKSSVKSDGGSEVMLDDGSEMEISENTISNDGCREGFSEEVTSKAILAEHMFEQHDSISDESTVSCVFQQYGSPENALSDAQKELVTTTSEIENAPEGSDIVCNIVDSMNDAQKEMEAATYGFEETGTAHESNSGSISTCFDDGAQMEPKINTCMSKDASEGSDVSQGRNLDGNTEYVADGTEMGPEITICKLDDACEETGIDQETVEDDDFVCVGDNDQNDHSEMTECKLGDASKDSFTAREANLSDSSANVSSDTQNESNHSTSELALGISEDTANESKMSTCQPGHVFEEFRDDGSSAYTTDAIQNESEFSTFDLEGAQEDLDVVKEDEGKANGAYSQKLECKACESGCASERPAMSQDADGQLNIIDSSDSAQKDISIPKLNDIEDIQTAEETNQSFNVEIPEHKYDCTAEDHAGHLNIAAEVMASKEPSIDDICDAFSGMNLKGDVYFYPDESTTCPKDKLIISRRRRTPEEEEFMRGFNPRAPNFLSLELDPDAEKVDLRHQMVDERKNAEEWMIDYALRRAVTNLAPARKKKVELLVQAFETVLPHDEDDKKSLTPTRPVQGCN